MKSAGWQFGPFVLVPSEHLLLRGGEPVRLPRKDFDLLVALVERAGQLVRKEELMERLWPNAFVEEGNLTKHVSMVRKALGDTGDAGALIETVPRVGFRFVIPVTWFEAADAASIPVTPAAEARAGTAARTPPARVPTLRTAIAAFAVIGVAALSLAVLRPWNRTASSRTREWKALAVLPFATLDERSGEPDHLGIGLADGIITRLSGQRLLAVRPTSVVRAYAGAGRADLKAIGGALDADVVLEGHIQRAADTVRVTVQLTDVAQGAPIWAATFDQHAAELFRLEDAIADRVAGALRLQIGAAEQDRLRRRYTENAAAYDAYLAGRDSLLRYTPDGTREAVRSFERALALDPSYALARAGLAMASADMYLRFAAEPELQQWGERAEREAAAALALDPDLAEAHAAMAAVLRKRDFDWDRAIVESRQALTLNPNLDQPHLVQAAAFYHLGLMDLSRAELDTARAVPGVDRIEPIRVEALIALFSGDFTTARRLLEDVSRHSSQPIGDAYLALAYFYTGDPDRARQMLAALSTGRSASSAARSGAALASILAALHDRPAAQRVLDSVLARGYRDHHVAYSLAAAYAQLGDEQHAIQWLRSAAETGFPCLTWFARDPLLEPIRLKPGFIELFSHLEARRAAAAARYRQ